MKRRIVLDDGEGKQLAVLFGCSSQMVSYVEKTVETAPLPPIQIDPPRTI